MNHPHPDDPHEPDDDARTVYTQELTEPGHEGYAVVWPCIYAACDYGRITYVQKIEIETSWEQI